MPRVSVRVDGLTEARASVAALPQAFKDVAAEELLIGSNIILTETNARVPVRFGKLKASLGRNIREDGLQIAVGFGDPKAQWVEFATEDTPAQPSLFPAFRLGARYIRRTMRSWAEKAGERVAFKTKRSNRTRVKK